MPLKLRVLIDFLAANFPDVGSESAVADADHVAD
jgi:hypothetical protein